MMTEKASQQFDRGVESDVGKRPTKIVMSHRLDGRTI